MTIHPMAGDTPPIADLVNIPDLMTAYYALVPDVSEPSHRVAFGTSGHRGTAFKHSFNEAHVLAVTQAVCDYRRKENITGPLFMGRDTHALSKAAHTTALEVLAANNVTVCIDDHEGYVPTPVISYAILTYNAGRTSALADGIVITPSHNPPQDGGFKYNPPHGGPADTAITSWIEERANALLSTGNIDVRRMPYERARKAETTWPFDFISPYVGDLSSILDMEAIKNSGLRLGVDPLGGAGMAYWGPIAETYGIELTVVNTEIDPTFRFMPLDKDGVVRMDCSSPYAMSSLITLAPFYDLAFGNDPDTDRHGIVTKKGLMNPNHYLSAAIEYLFSHRASWQKGAAIGKTLVSSSMIDRVAASLDRQLAEVPVGFKWFVPGLLDGSYGFGGEESAGASFLRKNGTVWSTDKDGIILNLLAAEMMAVTERSPHELYDAQTERFGTPVYERLDAPATPKQKAVLKNLTPEMITVDSLANNPITAILTHAPANGAAIGGLKVVSEAGWFAARPSGTEDIYKIYTESFEGAAHLKVIQEEAQFIVGAALQAAGT